MEKETFNITREELDDFMSQIEGIKSTIEILQNKELVEQIEESEEIREKGSETYEIDV